MSKENSKQRVACCPRTLRCGRADTFERGQWSGRVGLGLDEREGGQVLDLARVEVGLEREVVVVQRLVVRQLRQEQGPVEAAVVADREFLGQHQVEEVEIAELALLGPAGQLVVLRYVE
jgi:hypothetical protein